MPGQDDDRREFLKTCGRFAAVTPPAMTLLLSTSLTTAHCKIRRRTCRPSRQQRQRQWRR